MLPSASSRRLFPELLFVAGFLHRWLALAFAGVVGRFNVSLSFTQQVVAMRFRLAPVISQSLSCGFLVAAICCATLNPASAESWTSLAGSSIDAKLVGIWEGNAILLLNDGRRAKVDLNNLNAVSRIRAREVDAERRNQRKYRVNELQSQATAEAAPAPTPLPQQPPADPYVEMPPGLTLADSCAHVIEQSNRGHLLIAMYDALPASYQQDIDAIAKKFGDAVSEDDWNAIRGSLFMLGDVVVSHQNWILSYPRLKATGSEGEEVIRSRLLPLGGLLRDMFDPQSCSLESFRSTPFREWLADRDAVLAAYYPAFSDLIPSPSFEILEEKDDTASVKLMQGEDQTTVAFSKVEGRWVPADMAKDWAENIEKAKTDFPAQIVPGGKLQVVPLIAGGVTAALTQAKSAAEFHAAIETTVLPLLEAQVGPAIAQLQASRGRSRGGQDGYDDDMYDDDMYEDEDMYEEDMEMESYSDDQ